MIGATRVMVLTCAYLKQAVPLSLDALQLNVSFNTPLRSSLSV
jgi:hypothetical protein